MLNDNSSNNCLIDINPFKFSIAHSTTNKSTHTYQINLHSHKEWEIYINLSGDVSFLVNDNLYPLSRGDIIIAKPNEQHHCVYHSNKTHSLFWILIDSTTNTHLDNFPFDSNIPNFISLPDNLKDELINICTKLNNTNETKYDQILLFFKLIDLIKSNGNINKTDRQNTPQDLKQMLRYIDDHINEPILVKDISNALYLSESTIIRRFREYVKMSPLEFIKKKKLVLAAELLKNGNSVLSAGESVGYNDNSYFIEIFKKQYAITPNQYKKLYSKSGA